MADVTTIAELGTAVGTLFLGVATFASVRSANRAARVAERSLLLGLRPVLTPSRPEDADQEILFGDGRRYGLRSDRAIVDRADDVIYLAIPLHNVGAGLAVLQHYYVMPEDLPAPVLRPHMAHDRDLRRHAPVEEFRPQQRDLYIASGDIGYWQAAFRDPAEEVHGHLQRALAVGQPITVELLYGDHEGGQHLITRFHLQRNDEGEWSANVIFHWSLEGADPRPID
jgi:hypothetical protein